jgi:DNA-binding response OmpR family regulator
MVERKGKPDKYIIELGQGFQLDLLNGEVSKDGVDLVKLSQREAGVLVCTVSNKELIFVKDISDRLTGGRLSGEAIQVVISRLRKKVKPVGYFGLETESRVEGGYWINRDFEDHSP